MKLLVILFLIKLIYVRQTSWKNPLSFILVGDKFIKNCCYNVFVANPILRYFLTSTQRLKMYVISINKESLDNVLNFLGNGTF